MSGLPGGWTTVRVEGLGGGEGGALTDGPFGSNLKTCHYTTTGPRVIRLQNIGEGTFRDDQAHVEQAHFERLRKHEALAGDVVVAMLGDVVPRACLVPAHVGPAIVKADCVRLRVAESIALARYVAAGLNSDQLRRQAERLVHGVGRPRLGLGRLRELEFPLAPLPEQRRIVECLDSYTSRLDEAEAALERVRRNLKRYRAAVLQAAVEGRLVPTEAELARAEGRDYEPASELLKRILAERRRRWEESELARLKTAGTAPKDDRWKAKYEEPQEVPARTLPAVPEGWCWATLDCLAEVKGGITKNEARRTTEPMRDVPYLRVANVQRGRLELSDVATIKATAAEVQDLRLRPGDILFNEGGDRDKLGRGWVWQGQIAECIHQNHVFRARLHSSDVIPEYVSWYGNSSGQRYFFDQGKQTTNLASLNMTKLKRLPVPLPPAAEQRRIALRVQALLSAEEEVSRDVSVSIQRALRLRQSILKWAFEGKLVDQDPNDEPASVLLDRIRREREQASEAGESRARRARPRKGR